MKRRSLLRCMSPKLALSGPRKMSSSRPLSGEKRTLNAHSELSLAVTSAKSANREHVVRKSHRREP
jgi:hypothetical protein